MSSTWHDIRWTWSTVEDDEIDLVVSERLPDWGLTSLSRRIAARRLTEQGAGVEEIAELVGVDTRTVYRWRRAERAKCGGNPNNQTRGENEAA